MTTGFEADGGVEFENSNVGSLNLFGGRFINPGAPFAFLALADKIAGDVLLSLPDWLGSSLQPSPARFEGEAEFVADAVGGLFSADEVIFDGGAQSARGLSVTDTSITGSLFLRGMELRNGATLNLEGSSAH